MYWYYLQNEFLCYLHINCVFRHVKELENLGLSAPQITYIMKLLKERGLDVNTDVLRVSEAAAEILAHRRELHV